jgi:conjugative transfer signal peptidase TraF
MNKRRAVVMAAMLSVAALGAPVIAHPIPRLIWNATASVPVGLYRVMPATDLRRGDFVLAWLPDAARRLAAERDYLPAHVPLVKRVARLAGDTICSEESHVTINGIAVATALALDSHGRALPYWRGCRMLGQNEAFLLMPSVPDSFDGRYFGPIAVSSIIGKLVPLWTW